MTHIFKNIIGGIIACIALYSCDPNNDTDPFPLSSKSKTVNGISLSKSELSGVSIQPVFRITFSHPLDKSAVTENISLVNETFSGSNTPVETSWSLEKDDSVLVVQPAKALNYLSCYKLDILTNLRSNNGGTLSDKLEIKIQTVINPADKRPQISDEALLDTIQKATFNYFWTYDSETSGLVPDRNTAGKNYCAIGATGFGIMTIPGAIERGFITRQEGLDRIEKIVDFLKNKVSTYKGVFPHYVNGTTGAIITVGDLDGWDTVETSFLMMGLLTARQYFDGSSRDESNLRSDINSLYEAVEWTWYQNKQNALFWSWNPTGGWGIKLVGWNETLITYVLAASSPTHGIDKLVYDQGFAGKGWMKDGTDYYGFTLPLGKAGNFGGPLFISQFQFLGINPKGLSDPYADYSLQATNHALINHDYCKRNPLGYSTYSDECWGLTAGATWNKGYQSMSPVNDLGYVLPSAAVASLPYAPQEAMKAIKYFYYKLGDILWTEYGFADSFSLDLYPYWVSSEVFGYDQLNMFIAIENHRSGLIWELFTSSPEVKAGMKKLGFTAPYLTD
jgi:hypothetical protein